MILCKQNTGEKDYMTPTTQTSLHHGFCGKSIEIDPYILENQVDGPPPHLKNGNFFNDPCWIKYTHVYLYIHITPIFLRNYTKLPQFWTHQIRWVSGFLDQQLLLCLRLNGLGDNVETWRTTEALEDRSPER